MVAGVAYGPVAAAPASAVPLPPAPSRAPSAPVVADLVAALRAGLNDTNGDKVRVDPEELAVYGRDAYSYHSGRAPDVVVLPASTAEVQLVVKECYKRKVPIVARGSGTSLEGHATTPHGGVCIDLSHMTRVLQVRPDDLDATVEPGVTWSDLNAAIAHTGLFFPVDPGPGASIGGMCATNASGTNATRYGPMKANVLSMTVVMADGTIIKTASRARKCSAGYDLTSLFIGSEGTLGINTEVTVRLVPTPPVTAVAVCSFPSVEAASRATADIVRAGVQVGAIELLDAPMIKVVNVESGFSYPPAPHLFIKLTGTAARVAADAEAVKERVGAHGCVDFQWTHDAAGQAKLWQARKVALWSAGAHDPSRKIATTDVAVPLSALPGLMARIDAEPKTIPVYAVGHAGDGNVHHFLAFNPSDPAEVAEAKRINELLVRTAIELGGTCTGEHGTGVGKTRYLTSEYGSDAVLVMHAVKNALDPEGLLNPGKKLPRLAEVLLEKAAAEAPAAKPLELHVIDIDPAHPKGAEAYPCCEASLA